MVFSYASPKKPPYYMDYWPDRYELEVYLNSKTYNPDMGLSQFSSNGFFFNGRDKDYSEFLKNLEFRKSEYLTALKKDLMDIQIDPRNINQA